MIDSDPAGLEVFTVLARGHANRVLNTQTSATVEPPNDDAGRLAGALTAIWRPSPLPGSGLDPLVLGR
jgi:hypothetical protein